MMDDDNETQRAFISIRLKFYSDEMNTLFSYDNYMPAKIYDAFYLKPLCSEPEVADDISEVLNFYSVLNEMIKNVAREINKL